MNYHIGSSGRALARDLAGHHDVVAQIRREYPDCCRHCVDGLPLHGNTHMLPNGDEAPCREPMPLDHTGARVV